ncbi:hypothetical protein EHN06_15885 [Marinobacter sp. NP-4(2019)]|uniref:hypothetical protein n=1 Tax=Marinobacter sp. NP-4(2019) TaxID=2488665 RepID=UPI000FC3DCE3|nr:hypothetical protein [Marinobacter sp. NP-4(2019)]AZT84911.1 hypothetical protein EHN06_15885 [Marinobacter sp. NP-4(2019)]
MADRDGFKPLAQLLEPDIRNTFFSRSNPETGEESVTIDTNAFSDLPPDENYDHIQHLIDHTNKIRNIYAHGSAMLHNRVLYSFELVSEFINQLYPVAKQISSTAKE